MRQGRWFIRRKPFIKRGRLLRGRPFVGRRPFIERLFVEGGGGHSLREGGGHSLRGGGHSLMWWEGRSALGNSKFNMIP